MTVFTIKNKKIDINEHEHKITIDFTSDKYDKKIVITDDDIKIFNNKRII